MWTVMDKIYHYISYHINYYRQVPKSCRANHPRPGLLSRGPPLKTSLWRVWSPAEQCIQKGWLWGKMETYEKLWKTSRCIMLKDWCCLAGDLEWFILSCGIVLYFSTSFIFLGAVSSSQVLTIPNEIWHVSDLLQTHLHLVSGHYTRLVSFTCLCYWCREALYQFW